MIAGFTESDKLGYAERIKSRSEQHEPDFAPP